MRLKTTFQQPRCLPSRGFTLIELIVVLAILATLVGLILPGIEAARSTADRKLCATNLLQIGLAYHVFVDDHGGKPSAFRTDPKWMNQLKPYLQDNSEVFVCPLDVPVEFPTSQFARASLAVSAHPDILIVIVLSLDGPKCRLSSKPGPTLGSFYLEILPNARSSWLLLVEPESDDMVRVTAGSTGWRYGDMWGNRLTSPSLGYIGELDRNLSLVLPKHDVPSPFEPEFIRIPIISSYGVNSMADYFGLSEDGSKVLVAEYKRFVCNVVNYPAADPPRFATDFWTNDCAPRHHGSLNVLFVDGSVRGMHPSEMNPRSRIPSNEYWMPTKLRQ